LDLTNLGAKLPIWPKLTKPFEGPMHVTCLLDDFKHVHVGTYYEKIGYTDERLEKNCLVKLQNARKDKEKTKLSKLSFLLACISWLFLARL